MCRILIIILFFLTNLHLSVLLTKNELADAQENSTETMINHDNTVNCSMQVVHVDKPRNKRDISYPKEDYVLKFMHSSWQQIVKTRDDNDEDEFEEINDDPSSLLNIIQVIFNIPFSLSNGSILNQTVFITDPIHNQLLGTFNHICINEATVIINYATNKPLPHDVCLYLLFNQTESIALKEIFICRTLNKNISLDSSDSHDSHGPSVIFIISQSIIIIFMMIIICLVQTAREKRVIYRITQHLNRDKSITSIHNIHKFNYTINHQKPNENHSHNFIEEQVRTATDLTPTRYDRKFTSPTLIDIKEFTRRLSVLPKDNEITMF